MMDGRLKDGLSYIEVLGGLLIILIVSHIVLVGLSLNYNLYKQTRQGDQITRLTKNLMTSFKDYFREISLEELEKTKDLKQVLKGDWIEHYDLETYDYEIGIWEIQKDEVLSKEPLYWLSTTPQKGYLGKAPDAKKVKEAYAFIWDVKPKECLGTVYLEADSIGDYIELKPRTSYIEYENKNYIKIKEEETLHLNAITYSLEELKPSPEEKDYIILVIDCSKLPQKINLNMEKKVIFVNRTDQKVSIKKRGHMIQKGYIETEVLENDDFFIVHEQETLEEKPFLVKYTLRDKKNQILEETVLLMEKRCIP